MNVHHLELFYYVARFGGIGAAVRNIPYGIQQPAVSAQVWLPPALRDSALAILPSLHAYEMIRAGLFGDQVQTFYDFGYASAYLAVLTLIGLWLIRDVRRHLELDW